jgi:hypothetical protein
MQTSSAAEAERPVCDREADGRRDQKQMSGSAGPIFQMQAPSGPFHGMIAPTTPTGSFKV